MRFADFLIFDEAARAVFTDLDDQRAFRCYLERLEETARRYPGTFLAEAAASRKGVAFRQKALDDTEHAVFAGRLADRLPTKPAKGDYGNFLRRGILQQGQVLGDMKWGEWEVTKAVLELGGVDPAAVTNPKTTPAQRMALLGQVNWASVTLPRLKTALGGSLRVPDDWKRQFAIEKLKRIKAAVEQGTPLNAEDGKLLNIWRTLEIQLGDDILPAGPKSDVGLTTLPMSRVDRKRFYRTLTGTNEAVNPGRPLRLSAQSAYDYLTQRYNVEIINNEEATDLYLARILTDLKNGNAFIPSSARGSEADAKRWRDSAARSWGGFLGPGRFFDPGNAPGFSQWLSGMTTKGFQMRTNASGRRVPSGYPEPEDFKRQSEEVPGIHYSIDAPSQEVADQKINSYYRSGTPEANAAVEQELLKPARNAVNWLRTKGWIDDPAKVDDYVQDVVVGMLGRTGSVPNWRSNVGFRRATASMLARRFASQGWPSQTKERTGHMGRAEEQPGALYSAAGSNRGGGEDPLARVQGGVARARQAIQRVIASLMGIDTSKLGGEDGAKFTDAIDSLSDPKYAARAIGTLDHLAARYAVELPQVQQAMDRIHRHLEPLMAKMRIGADEDIPSRQFG